MARRGHVGGTIVMIPSGMCRRDVPSASPVLADNHINNNTSNYNYTYL